MTRRRLIVLGGIVVFVAALAGVGAISRSTSSTAATSVSVSPAKSVAPSVSWYWTMAVAPSNPTTLILGTSSGLYRSADAGKTWKPTGPKVFNATSVVDAGSAIFAAGSVTKATSGPVVKTGNRRYASDGSVVFAASVDAGKTWRLLHPVGLPNATVQALTVDPGTNAVYALSNNGKLYSSTDGAKSFKLVDANIGIPAWALAVTQGGHFVGGDMDAGPHTSSNAKAWQKTAFSDGNGGSMVMEYAVQPKNATQVLMTSNGIVISSDGGRTWKTALKSTTMFGPVAYAPSSPNTAYAVGFDGSLWRSTDGGKSWSQ
jgi:photosystem II stability/assembly factor-like uncharacterized protein